MRGEYFARLPGKAHSAESLATLTRSEPIIHPCMNPAYADPSVIGFFTLGVWGALPS